MSIRRYMWRNIGMFLAAAVLLCAVLSAGTACFLIENNRAALQERRLDGALEEVLSTIQESGGILRDIANDPSLHHFVQRGTQVDSMVFGDGLTKLYNHLLYILLTQNDFRGLMLQADNITVAHFGSRVAAVTSHFGASEMSGDAAENMRRLSHDQTISDQCVFSVRTNDGFVISGLVDLEGTLGDALGDCVVYDGEGRLLLNGLVDRCSDSVIENFISSGSDRFEINGETMRVARKSAGAISVAMFEREEPIFSAHMDAAHICAAALAAGLLLALALRGADGQLKGLIAKLKQSVPAQAGQPECRAKSRKLRAQRRNCSMQTWLWMYLVRICALPIALLVVAGGWLCAVNLRQQYERYTVSIVEQQLAFANMHYERCDSFLRNATFDYLLQEYMSGARDASDASILQDYSAVLWNKCSERDALKSIAIFDSDWNRVYLTGSVDIDAEPEIAEHFEDTFSIYARRDEDRVVCCLGIREACIRQSDISKLYNCYGYMTIVLADPVSWLKSQFDDARVQASIVDEHGAPADVPAGFVRVYGHIPMLDCQIEVLAPVFGDYCAGASSIVLTFAVLLTGLFSILVLTANKLSLWMLNMLMKLQDAIEGIYQGADSQAASTGVMEIDFVVECFQSMAVALERKQMELNRKQIELLNEQKRRVDLQLAAIESQLSPHFLFNIFTSIRFLLEEENVGDAKQMLKLTTRLFRSTLYRGSTLTTLGAEMEHIRNYMEIQCFRHKDQLALSIAPFSEELLDALLPQYTLQPLVENAIEHALPVQGRLSISIRAEFSGDELRIAIDDDGGAVTRAEIERIYNLLETDDPRAHCGLSNVNKRLKLHFGEKYGLRFDVNGAHGLSVEVYVPYCLNAEEFEQEV